MTVCEQHDPTAIPAVHQGSHKRAPKSHRAACPTKVRRLPARSLNRSGYRQVPDEGKLHQLAAQNRERLSTPNGKETWLFQDLPSLTENCVAIVVLLVNLTLISIYNQSLSLKDQVVPYPRIGLKG